MGATFDMPSMTTAGPLYRGLGRSVRVPAHSVPIAPSGFNECASKTALPYPMCVNHWLSNYPAKYKRVGKGRLAGNIGPHTDWLQAVRRKGADLHAKVIA
jgi:hypothetical protein